MTVSEIRPGILTVDIDGHPESTAHTRLAALTSFIAVHRVGMMVGLGILVVTGLTHGIGFDGYPGRINDDEGTYVAQAYAMDFHHSIAPYTYTYDHPFGGWLLMAVFFWTTGALHWATTAVTAGRLFMLMVHLVSCLVLYGLARRLQMNRVAAFGAVALFSLSPVAIYYQRLVFIDNIAVMWLLVSLYIAASPKRRISGGLLAGVTFALAIWSKETAAILLPTVYWVLRQHSDPFNRRMVMRAFWGTLISGLGIYGLYALTKGELLPGAGHVSLLSSLDWQLFSRPSSGSVLNTHSGAYGLVSLWIHTDPVLLIGGAAAAIPALIVPRLRPIALALGIQIVMLLRGGYLPFAYVTAFIPFAALAMAGSLDYAWRGQTYVPDDISELIEPSAYDRAARSLVAKSRSVVTAAPRSSRVMVTLVTALLVTLAALQWPAKVSHAMTTDDSRNSYLATQWFLANEPHASVVLTDDDIWTDLHLADPRIDPVWLFKLDLDPSVKADIGGWRGVDYTILGPLSDSDVQTLPTVDEVLRHSVVVKTFGTYSIRKVIK